MQTQMYIDIGIEEEARHTIAAALSQVLADSYALYLKTQGFHWNVTGPMFRPLHTLFEAQYGELALAIDEVAERIRALGAPAPGSFTQLTELASIPEELLVPNAESMLAQLVEGHEAVARTARRALTTAQRAGDEASADLLVARLRVHEKAAWMLRAQLG